MFLVVFLPFYFTFSRREFWWERNDQDIAILWLHYLLKYNATFFLFVMTFRVATTETSAIHFLPSLKSGGVMYLVSQSIKCLPSSRWDRTSTVLSGKLRQHSSYSGKAPNKVCIVCLEQPSNQKMSNCHGSGSGSAGHCNVISSE